MPVLASTPFAILLTFFLCTASASHRSSRETLPTDYNTNLWTPISTIWPADPIPSFVPVTPSVITTTPTPTSIAVIEERNTNSQKIAELKKRQVTGQSVPLALPTAADQISPVTTYGVNIYINGVAQPAQVVYTQLFAKVPDQWPSPSAGSIGLGTIQGKVGEVKTRRSLPTQEPVMMIPGNQVGSVQSTEDDAPGKTHIVSVEISENKSSLVMAGSTSLSLLFVLVLLSSILL